MYATIILSIKVKWKNQLFLSHGIESEKVAPQIQWEKKNGTQA